jgi:hypothetical protein
MSFTLAEKNFQCLIVLYLNNILIDWRIIVFMRYAIQSYRQKENLLEKQNNTYIKQHTDKTAISAIDFNFIPTFVSNLS